MKNDHDQEFSSLIKRLKVYREWISERKKNTSDDRSVFMYSESKGLMPEDEYAQCSACHLWTEGHCMVHGPEIEVTGDMTCSYYVEGEPLKEMAGKEIVSVTPGESELQKRQVRCENCTYFSEGKCGFYKRVNEALPDLFHLNENVNAKACCSMNTEKK